jgi:Ca2+-binding EF-hand superfamily protein
MCGLAHSDEELQTLRKIFIKLDTDKNGYITEDEIE